MRIITVVLLWLMIGSALAQEAAKPITVQEALTLRDGLKGLDGKVVIVKQNGNDVLVPTPWEFNNGKLRLRIANNTAIIERAIKAANDAQQATLKESLAKASARLDKPVTELVTGMPERADYDQQYNDLLASPAAGTKDLSRIKASELNLDKNDIPPSVLSSLRPIFDVDVK